MNSEPSPSLNKVTSVSESEEEDGGSPEEANAVEQTYLSDSKKEEIKSNRLLKSGPSEKRLCKTFVGCHARGASFVWQTDPGILSHKVPTQSGVYSWQHKFSEGQARSNRTKLLERQQRAKPLCFI